MVKCQDWRLDLWLLFKGCFFVSPCRWQFCLLHARIRSLLDSSFYSWSFLWQAANCFELQMVLSQLYFHWLLQECGCLCVFSFPEESRTNFAWSVFSFFSAYIIVFFKQGIFLLELAFWLRKKCYSTLEIIRTLLACDYVLGSPMCQGMDCCWGWS